MTNISEIFNTSEVIHHGLLSVATKSSPQRVFTSSAGYLNKLYKLLGYKSLRTAETLEEYKVLPVLDLKELPQVYKIGVINNSEFILADEDAIQNYNKLKDYLSTIPHQYNYNSGNVICDEIVLSKDDGKNLLLVVDLNSEWAQVVGVSTDSSKLILTPIEILNDFHDVDAYEIIKDILEDDYEPDDYSEQYSKLINAKDLKYILTSLGILKKRRKSYSISDSHELADFDVVEFSDKITGKSDTELSSINTDVSIDRVLRLITSVMDTHSVKYRDIIWIYDLIKDYVELPPIYLNYIRVCPVDTSQSED